MFLCLLKHKHWKLFYIKNIYTMVGVLQLFDPGFYPCQIYVQMEYHYHINNILQLPNFTYGKCSKILSTLKLRTPKIIA